MQMLAADMAYEMVSLRGRSFQVISHPLVARGAGEFMSGSEEGTLRFFDAVLPACERMIDCGAYIGFTTLYAAGFDVDVTSFEPSDENFPFLAANVAANPGVSPRIMLCNTGVGVRDEWLTLYTKGDADSGSSVFQVVERRQAVMGRAGAKVQMRAAAAVLRGAGVDRRTLLKIDIEGAEYAVLPAIADLLAECKPWLHVSFHPFNLAAECEPYIAMIRRLGAAMQVAEATASYRYMHLFDAGAWCTIGPADRMSFLRQYLLRPKALPGLTSPQFGFIDAVAFSDEPLPAGA